MVVSDHSPCSPDLKLLPEGDFMRAWGGACWRPQRVCAEGRQRGPRLTSRTGIGGLQFSLSVVWTECVHNRVSIEQVRDSLSLSLVCART